MLRWFFLFMFCVVSFAIPAQAQVLTGYGDGVSVDSAPADVPVEAAPRVTGISKVPDLQVTAEDSQSSDGPVDLEADDVRYDDESRIVTASGNVIIVQDGRILRADDVVYNLDEDTVVATGNVVLNEPSGDIHFSQRVEFNNKLKDGFVEGLESYLDEGGGFSAVNGHRKGGVLTVMKDAVYSACEPCQDNPDRPLPWRIRASEVEHDKDAARVSYENARFEVFGVPVAYTPFFAHADGSIKRKSGFLPPSFAFQSSLGASIESQYYWNIAPDKDATIGLHVFSEELPLGTLQYRQRWNNAGLEINGGGTYSERTDENTSGVDFEQDKEFRGHIFAKAQWDMNDKWRSGFDLAYVSDDQYANQYDITNEDVLTSSLYAERFFGRNYAQALVQGFQDIRISDLEVDQPEVLPELTASFIGEPGQVPLIKGRWDAHVGFLSLYRDGDGQDVSRGSVDLGWERRLVSDYGLVTNVETSLRGDLFQINDRDLAFDGSGRSGSSTESRFFPQIHVQSSYPVARNFANSQLVIEPIVALSASPEIKSEDDIPNEDSQDVQLDSSNLFEPNRFPGLDIVEDEARVTYGVRSGLYGAQGSSLEGFVGQSYRFDADSIPFAAGSGLDQQNSDVVGYVNAKYEDRYALGYRFQLENDSLSPQRHELDASADWNRLRLNANYLFAKPLDGTEIVETREQLSANGTYYLTDEWRLHAGATQDLGADPGLRRSFLGLDYFGQCVSWSLTGVRNLTDDASGDSDTEILFRIGLRNLGEFARSDLRDVEVLE